MTSTSTTSLVTVLRTDVGPFLRGRRLVVALAATSLLAGAGEAALLILIVKVATTLTAGGSSAEVRLGGGELVLSTGDVLLVASGLLVALLAAAALSSALSATVITRSVRDARTTTSTAFLKAAWPVQAGEGEGVLQQVLTAHVQRLGLVLLQVTNGIAAAVALIAYLTAAVVVDPLFAATALAGASLAGLLLIPLNIRTKRVSVQSRDAIEDYATTVAQTVRTARELHVFGVGPRVADLLARLALRAEHLQWHARLLAKLTPSAYRVVTLGLIVLALGLAQGTEPDRLGDLGALLLLLVRAVSFGQQLFSAGQQLTEALPYLTHIRRLQDRFISAEVKDAGIALSRVEVIELDRVSIAYETGQDVLTDVSLTLRRGEVLGIVGPSGSGKSTLVQLLLGLRPPESGRYYVNGQRAGDLARESWARAFAFVPQDNELLRGTVLDNIRFFRPWIDDATVEGAAHSAHLHDEITSMPEGYLTMLGTGVRQLSGGQRQRLGLARALAGGPQVLVLDEPTSALDMQSEELVQNTLADLRGSMTVVVVAHRMSTLTSCDEILVLDAGRVMAKGPHAMLMRDSDYYRDAVSRSRLSSSRVEDR